MSSDEWKKTNTSHIAFRVMNSSGIPNALALAEKNSGKTKSGYIVAALREALIRDGYLKPDETETE